MPAFSRSLSSRFVFLLTKNHARNAARITAPIELTAPTTGAFNAEDDEVEEAASTADMFEVVIVVDVRVAVRVELLIAEGSDAVVEVTENAVRIRALGGTAESVISAGSVMCSTSVLRNDAKDAGNPTVKVFLDKPHE